MKASHDAKSIRDQQSTAGGNSPAGRSQPSLPRHCCVRTASCEPAALSACADAIAQRVVVSARAEEEHQAYPHTVWRPETHDYFGRVPLPRSSSDAQQPQHYPAAVTPPCVREGDAASVLLPVLRLWSAVLMVQGT